MKNADMKHKKVIIPSIVAIIAITMWATIPISTERSEGYVVLPNLDELVADSELVIIGTLNSQKVEDVDSDIYPLRSITNFKILEVVKGNYTGSTIDVIDEAEGYTFKDGYKTKVEPSMWLAEFHPSETVLLFLYYDDRISMGPGYFIDGSAVGKYTINGEKAIGFTPDRNTTLKDIRDRLS